MRQSVPPQKVGGARDICSAGRRLAPGPWGNSPATREMAMLGRMFALPARLNFSQHVRSSPQGNAPKRRTASSTADLLHTHELGRHRPVRVRWSDARTSRRRHGRVTGTLGLARGESGSRRFTSVLPANPSAAHTRLPLVAAGPGLRARRSKRRALSRRCTARAARRSCFCAFVRHAEDATRLVLHGGTSATGASDFRQTIG